MDNIIIKNQQKSILSDAEKLDVIASSKNKNIDESAIKQILEYEFDLTYSKAMELELSGLYERVSSVIPEIEWPVFAPYIYHINKLKRKKNAVILAHNYMTPEIFHCVSDYRGDSLELAIKSSKTDRDLIIMCGVYFMAETSKLLNPDKKVLIPDIEAGCSLSESITGADVKGLREKYPGVPVVTYVNTSAEVKAETDICCTSSNVDMIINSLDVDEVLCIPDQYLADNTKAKTKAKLIKWPGSCIVHEQFAKDDMLEMREAYPGIKIIAHPECKPEIIEVSDFSGSTKGMINWVKENQPEKVMMVTECSMSDNVSVENPNVDFVRPCNLCPFMKKITLPKILYSLYKEVCGVEIEEEIAKKARVSVERMINLSN